MRSLTQLPLKSRFGRKNGVAVTLATKLILGSLFIILLISLIFIVVGIQIISDRVLSEAQEKVRRDLNAAREIYLSKLNFVNDVVRFTADRFLIKEALLSGNLERATEELTRIRKSENLDVLAITNAAGIVLTRGSNTHFSGDDRSHDELVAAALNQRVPVSATTIASLEDLREESPTLPAQAYFKFIDTPKARARPETEETAGMMLLAAAPIFDNENNLAGVVYGGVLLNRNFEIVDKIKQTVFQDMMYKGKDIGTATIFQDDVRISTNVKNQDGSRAIGTRIAEDVYNQVIKQGNPWIGRAYVVNDWYITAYEPIRNINQKIIGVLYVGILEERYLDIRRQTTLFFLAITLGGALLSFLAAYFISRRITVPLNQLVTASQEVTRGNLDTTVTITTNDELQVLAESFNTMALALKKRDEQLKEFTTRKIMESERLALVGQLSANVAHELNNPLTGIVTYSHLLLERIPSEDPVRPSVEKIAGQANRCRDIIRGLLDFARQRKPDKTLCMVNSVLQECVSLVENQALFHNIQIIENYQSDLPMVVIDPAQIERVFMNLIINAAEAMDGAGRLTLTTHLSTDRQCIDIEVSDTGHGIREEDMDKIFDPFFTTKDVGHGTGLGLAISYGIVKGHKGTIAAESKIGKGTTFTVKLPVNGTKEGASNGC
jgi:two-component system NtrC family sensor kinase